MDSSKSFDPLGPFCPLSLKLTKELSEKIL